MQTLDYRPQRRLSLRERAVLIVRGGARIAFTLLGLTWVLAAVLFTAVLLALLFIVFVSGTFD